MSSRNRTKQLIIKNIDLFNYYKERLINLALAQFEWQNLPETCDRDYFERCLLFKSKAAWYKPKDTDFILSTGFMTRKMFNAYGYPTAIYGVDFNGHNIETDDWEIIFDNKTRVNLIPKIELYASLLAEIHSTLRTNLYHQRNPYVVPMTRNEQLTYETFYSEVDEFSPYIPVKKNFDIESIKTLDLKTPYIGNDLYDTLKSIWAEALGMLGITAETTKKERLIQDEIMIDRQEDIISLNARLANRVEFCNKVNKRWGLDVSVNIVTKDEELELRDPREIVEEQIEEGSDE